MKKYEKPTLTVLSVSANDMLCACDVKTRGNPFFEGLDKEFGDGNGIFDENDNVFAGGEPNCDMVISGYCKFTTTDNVLFTS